jgi:hypothetical protein
MANSLSRQIKGFIKAAEQQGFRTKATKAGVMVYGKDGVSMVLLHLTPSDSRGVVNARKMLNKIGVRV